MQPAGPLEDSLRVPERVRQPGEYVRAHFDRIIEKIKPAGNVEVFDRRLPANAAGTAGQEAAPEVALECEARPQRDVGDVAHLVVVFVVVTTPLAIADRDGGDIGGGGNDALADQEAGRQVDVVAGRAHGHADGLTADPDAERFFGGEQVGALGNRGRVDADARHPPARRPSCHWSTLRPIVAVLTGTPLALAGYVGLDSCVAAEGSRTLRSMVENWPVYRQVTGRDRLGRGTAVRSPHTEAAAPALNRPTGWSKSICPYCTVGCGQRVFVSSIGGKDVVTQIEGDPDSPVSRGRLCPKGAASKQLVTHPGRLTRVLYRRPYGTAWEPLALDQAMDMIADRVLATRAATWQETFQGRAVHRTLGFASLGGATLDNEENYLIKKLWTATRGDPDRESSPDMTLRHRSRSGNELRSRRGDDLSPRSR